jgi:hypothetical protein
MSDKENIKGLRKAQVVELATAAIPTLAGHLKDFNSDNDIPAAAYIATLPEGVDSAAAAAVHRHDTVFLAASAKASQDASVAFMAKKANKEIDSVTTTFDMTGGMTATHNVKRSVERREMVDGEGKVIAPASTVFGATVSRLKVNTSGTKEMLAQGMEANAKLLG